jgi:hypothetical protein
MLDKTPYNLASQAQSLEKLGAVVDNVDHSQSKEKKK